MSRHTHAKSIRAKSPIVDDISPTLPVRCSSIPAINGCQPVTRRMSARYDMYLQRVTQLNRYISFHHNQHNPYTTHTHSNQVKNWRAYSRSAIGRCTLRTRLWLWILTLVFVGFTLHTSICACEVVHPHQGSTKPCVIRCHTTNRPAKSTAQLARQPVAMHPALLSLAIPGLAYPAVVDALPRFTLENSAPLLARGPPPVSAA